MKIKSGSRIKHICVNCRTLLDENGLKTVRERCSKCGGNAFECADVTKSLESLKDGPSPWEYLCKNCRSYFKVSVPQGPDEAKLIRCSNCSSSDIVRLGVCSLETFGHPCG